MMCRFGELLAELRKDKGRDCPNGSWVILSMSLWGRFPTTKPACISQMLKS